MQSVLLLGGLLDRQAASFAAAAAAGGGGQHTAAQDVQPPVSGPASSSTPFAGAIPGGSSTYRPVVTGSVLKRHGRDLTQDAADGRLDPLIGRHDVVERALQVGMHAIVPQS